MVGQITGKMFDHPIEKDCVSDLSDPGSCRIGPVRQVAGPENAAIQNLASMVWYGYDWDCRLAPLGHTNFRAATEVSFIPDMKFVKNFTRPDFQAKSFTPQKCVICNIFLAN